MKAAQLENGGFEALDRAPDPTERTDPVSAALRSVPTGTALGAVPDRAARDDHASSVRNELVYFAHLARLALPHTDLDDHEVSELRRDLAVLVAEATRTRLRPHLLHALVGAVLDELLPALPPAHRASLREARPLLDASSDTAS